MASPPVLSAGQRAQVLLAGPTESIPSVLFETDDIQIEAPNWSLDGNTLYVNGDGLLWALTIDDPGAGLRPVEFDLEAQLNNDHMLDPDGQHIYLSAMDTHIYRAPLAGGGVTRVSPDDGKWHFLHGVSPDGKHLVYVEISDFGQPGALVTVPVAGGPTTEIDTGSGHLDGPEWSPDGDWIYFNTEGFTGLPGHAQLARIANGGGPVERLLCSDSVDWFPHLSPDGRFASYLSFPAGTLGHPGDRDVTVTVVDVNDWTTQLQRYSLFGGQGTLNVNSWSPDSTRFAFIAYPLTTR